VELDPRVAAATLVPHSAAQLDEEPVATSAPERQAGVPVVHRHHLLVRCSHWLNVPILLGLIVSGVSVYWASPVYQHKTDPQTGNFDPLPDIGDWICAHVPGLHQYSNPPDWVYNQISLCPGLIAVALRSVATRIESHFSAALAPFFHRKRAFGVLSNDRDFLEEHYA